MKPENTNNIAASPSVKSYPPLESQIKVSAKLVYLWATSNPHQSYDEWICMLEETSETEKRDFFLDSLEDVDGELFVSIDCARRFSWLSRHLTGAIFSTIIEEGKEAALMGNLEHVNIQLKGYLNLTFFKGQMLAEALHQFLVVKEPYHQWIARLRKNYTMKYNCEYQRFTKFDNNGFTPHAKDSGKGHIIFGPKFSEKIVTAEPTPRGQAIKETLEYSRELASHLSAS